MNIRKNHAISAILALISLGVIAFAAHFIILHKKSDVPPAAATANKKTQDTLAADSSSNNNSSNDSSAAEDSGSAQPAEAQPDSPADVAEPVASSYPLHTNITATVFWVGEPQGGGSSENNAISAWDDAWQKHYGCFDDPSKRNGYYPKGCTPKENPFYFDLPYNDFNWDTGDGRRPNASQVVPWAANKKWGVNESMLKNRWLKIIKGGSVCYAQWEDSGPYVYDDAKYVFGTNDPRPKSKEANNAGMDVSPAVRDCLKFQGINNDINKVSWQFVEAGEVPAGPWKNIVTTSGTYWP